MKKAAIYLMLLFCLTLFCIACKAMGELDRVYVYMNGKLVGTWRAEQGEAVNINKIAEGDTLTFSAKTDLGGLENSSIDVKDDGGGAG